MSKKGNFKHLLLQSTSILPFADAELSQLEWENLLRETKEMICLLSLSFFVTFHFKTLLSLSLFRTQTYPVRRYHFSKFIF